VDLSIPSPVAGLHARTEATVGWVGLKPPYQWRGRKILRGGAVSSGETKLNDIYIHTKLTQNLWVVVGLA
jgi:hypothetical protein